MSLYDAFVSYSHAKDKPIAAALQSVVQKLGKPWYRRRALRVFRDDTSLSATPHLWPTIEQALGQSRFFILMASPEAAASKWVNKEVAHWLEHNSVDTLLIGVTDGELAWDEASGDFGRHEGTPLPPALTGRFPAEPKWVDLRAYRDGADKRDARFTELAADFAAAIRGMPKEDLLSQEVKQQRKALRLAFSAAVLLLILGVGATAAGVLAYRAQQEAVAQRDRAEKTLAAATQTANGLVFDLAQRFRNAVGVPTALVKDILDRALALQKQLTASGQTTPELERSEAAALTESADTLLAIGDSIGAFEAADGGLAIMRKLASADPGNAARQEDLGTSLLRVGYVRLVAGDRAGALAAYEECLAIMRRLVAAGPGNGDWQHDLSISLEGVGEVRLAAGDRAGAQAAYEESLAILRKLAATDPGNAQSQRDVSVALVKIGDMRLAAGDLAGALAAYEESLAMRRKLAATDPGNAQSQRDVSMSLNKVGNARLAAGDRAGALSVYEESLPIMRKLAAADPGNAGWQRDVSVNLNKVGDVRREAGDRAGALAAYEEGMAIRRKLAAADPGNARWQRDLSVSIAEVGDVQLEAGEPVEALAAYEESLTIQRRLAAADPGNAGWQRDVSLSLDRVGNVRLAAGDRAGALAAYDESLAIRRKFAATDPGNPGWQAELVGTLARISDVSDPSQARAALSEALAIVEVLARDGKLTTAQQNWPQDLRDMLAKLYSKIGDVLRGQDKLDEALEAYREGLSLRQKLAAAEPDNTQRQRDLSMVYQQIGELAYRFVMARDFGKALEAADQAIALLPDEMWLYTNRAHALMFLGRVDEARAVYLRYRGTKLGERSWEAVIVEDFAELRKASLTHPLMDEIEKKFTAGG